MWRVLYRDGLSHAELVCAVAHELGHAYHEDDFVDDHIRDARQEARADRWAVRALITAKAYEQAEALVGSHAGALATELNVTVEYVDVWKALHEKALIQ